MNFNYKFSNYMKQKFEEPSREEGDRALGRVNDSKDKLFQALDRNEYFEKELAGKSWWQKLTKIGIRLPYAMAASKENVNLRTKEHQQAQKEYDKVVGAAKEAALVLQKHLERLGYAMIEACTQTPGKGLLYLDTTFMRMNYRSDTDGEEERAGRRRAYGKDSELAREEEKKFISILGQAANLEDDSQMEAEFSGVKLSITKLPDGSFSVITK